MKHTVTTKRVKSRRVTSGRTTGSYEELGFLDSGVLIDLVLEPPPDCAAAQEAAAAIIGLGDGPGGGARS